MRSSMRLAAVVVTTSLLAACGSQSASPITSRAHHAIGMGTNDVIAQTQAKLKTHPNDWQAVDLLAGAYLQKVREVGDPSYYPKVETLLNRALAHDASDAEATTLIGTLALARHQFMAALDWGRKAHALDPASSRALGIIGDAQTELGRYPEALRSVQQMVDLRPDLSSYARVSYARELFGDVPGAIEAMQKAVEAGGPVPENSAYTRVLLGNLYLNAGRPQQADREYRQALFEYPGYPYGLAGIARVEAATGRYPDAVGHYRQAVDTYPLPDFVIALGDVYAATGDQRRASETYDLAAAEQQLYRANGVDLDAELALFDADHRRDLSAALLAARAAMADRPSVRTADILAWTLFQTGDDRDAEAASRQALRLGTQDATMFFHRGMIEARLGQTAAAIADLHQALYINPYFSLLWAPVARSTLTSLGAMS
ncbi:MAG: tetratricopeptide repeat protein [Chloroflexi bacterium]|nr:MAG: tetratricopeptide repeat protein [Chloroflexota bacterium]